MWPRQLDIDVAIDDFRLAASLPLTPLEDMFNRLVERNALSRARDENPELRPMIRVRVACPSCGAPIFFLTLVTRGEEIQRACRRCRSEFPLAA